jgi:hypothetical protein
MKLYDMLDTIGYNQVSEAVESAETGAILQTDPRSNTQYIDAPVDKNGKPKKSRLSGGSIEGGEYPMAAIYPSKGNSQVERYRLHLEAFIGSGGEPIPSSTVNLKQLYADFYKGAKAGFPKMSSISQKVIKGLSGKVKIDKLTGIKASAYTTIIARVLAEAFEGAFNEYILNGDGIKAFNADFDWDSVEQTLAVELENPDNLSNVRVESNMSGEQFPINVIITLGPDSQMRLSDYYAHNITAVLQESYSKLGTATRDKETYVTAVISAHDKIASELGVIGVSNSGDAKIEDETKVEGPYTPDVDPNTPQDALATKLGTANTETL